jgi:hypothetical protein
MHACVALAAICGVGTCRVHACRSHSNDKKR